MRSFVGFAVICLFIIIVQVSADRSSNAKSARSVDVVNTRLATCDLSDVESKFEELITGAVYALADVIISLEGSVYSTVACAQSGVKGFWSCAHEVWADEIASVQENVKTYNSEAQDLIKDIVQELLACIKL